MELLQAPVGLQDHLAPRDLQPIHSTSSPQQERAVSSWHQLQSWFEETTQFHAVTISGFYNQQIPTRW